MQRAIDTMPVAKLQELLKKWRDVGETALVSSLRDVANSRNKLRCRLTFRLFIGISKMCFARIVTCLRDLLVNLAILFRLHRSCLRYFGNIDGPHNYLL